MISQEGFHDRQRLKLNTLNGHPYDAPLPRTYSVVQNLREEGKRSKEWTGCHLRLLRYYHGGLEGDVGQREAV